MRLAWKALIDHVSDFELDFESNRISKTGCKQQS